MEGRAITSSSILIDREIPSHLLRINKMAVRLLSYLRIYEIQELSVAQRGLPLVARAVIHSRPRMLYICAGSDGRKLAPSGYRLDPAAGSWEPLPDIRQPRAQAAGAPLAGRIFVCGGSDGQGTLRSAECYNPGGRRWEAVPTMLQARCGAAAVAVEASLIVCGGRDGASYLDTVERFKPRQMEGTFNGKVGLASFFEDKVFGTRWKWRVCTFCRGMVIDARDYQHERSILRSWPFFLTPKSSIAMVTQGGVGAQESVAGLPATVEGMTNKTGFLGIAIRDVATDEWVLSRRRTFCGGSKWKEGRDPENEEGNGNEEMIRFDAEELSRFAGREVTVDVVDAYSGACGWLAVRRATISGVEMAGAWEALPPMATKRCYAAGGKLPGRLYMCGGMDHPKRTFSSVESFDPLADDRAGRWAHAAPMSQPRSSAACAGNGGAMYVFGGHDGNLELPTIERLSWSTGVWEVLATMSQRRRFPGAASAAGVLYVFGGFDGKSYLTSGERFEEQRFRWEGLATPMPAPRAFCAVAALEFDP